MKNNDTKNRYAMTNPSPGDYWHEMMSPYFLIVDVRGDKITILNCMAGYKSTARVNDRDGWYFDFSKTMVVDKKWIKKAVKYSTIDAFVADVVSTDATKQIVVEWREFTSNAMKESMAKMQQEWEDFTGWTILKQADLH